MKKSKSFHEYRAEYKKLPVDPKTPKRRIALLTSFTLTGLSEVLSVRCAEENIFVDVYDASYGQYGQEINDKNSGFYRHEPELAFFFVDFESLAGDFPLYAHTMTPSERAEEIDRIVGKLQTMTDTVSSRISGVTVVHNFQVPAYSPLGILENRQELGLFELIRAANARLEARYKNDPRVFIFDYDGFCARAGKNFLFDPKMRYIGDLRLSFQNMTALAGEYLSYTKAVFSKLKKCIVVDLDNTLWGGILGESGFNGILLGQSEGQPYIELQKRLLALNRRGILLAINSRNDEAEAMKVVKDHPEMVLRPQNFSAVRINWNDKAENIASIAAELNIGVDSLVFLDDDPVVCARVSKSFPAVRVIELSGDPSGHPASLEDCTDFNMLQYTNEDRSRLEMMKAQKSRAKLEKESENLETFLRNLQTRIIFKKATPFEIPRIFQLLQKTNQFNMTTRRHPEALLSDWSKDTKKLVAAVRIEDKFGDNGIVGALIVDKSADTWTIDTFLLSCRVLGRRAEDAVLGFMMRKAVEGGVSRILAPFVETEKNAPAKGFYKKHGFSEVGGQMWLLETKNIKYPDLGHANLREEGF